MYLLLLFFLPLVSCTCSGPTFGAANLDANVSVIFLTNTGWIVAQNGELQTYVEPGCVFQNATPSKNLVGMLGKVNTVPPVLTAVYNSSSLEVSTNISPAFSTLDVGVSGTWEKVVGVGSGTAYLFANQSVAVRCDISVGSNLTYATLDATSTISGLHGTTITGTPNVDVLAVGHTTTHQERSVYIGSSTDFNNTLVSGALSPSLLATKMHQLPYPLASLQDGMYAYPSIGIGSLTNGSARVAYALFIPGIKAHTTIHVVNATGDLMVTLKGGDRSEVTAIVLQVNGTYLVSGHMDGNVYIWDISASSASPVQSITSGSAAIKDLALSPDGKLISGIATDGTLYVWTETVLNGVSPPTPPPPPPTCNYRNMAKEYLELRYEDMTKGECQEILSTIPDMKNIKNFVATVFSANGQLCVSDSFVTPACGSMRIFINMGLITLPLATNITNGRQLEITGGSPAKVYGVTDIFYNSTLPEPVEKDDKKWTKQNIGLLAGACAIGLLTIGITISALCIKCKKRRIRKMEMMDKKVLGRERTLKRRYK